MDNPLKIPELVDRVLDHLHDDARSLRVCSRVAKVWLPTSRFHLFREIVVEKGIARKQLLQCMEANPEIGQYVRAMELVNYTKDGPDRWPSLSRILELTSLMPVLHTLVLDYIELQKEAPIDGIIDTAGEVVHNLTISRCLVHSHRSLIRHILAFSPLRRLSLLENFPSVSGFSGELGAQECTTVCRISVDELWLDCNTHYDVDKVLAEVLDDRSPRILRFAYAESQELRIFVSLCSFAGARLEELQVTAGAISIGGESCPSADFATTKHSQTAHRALGHLPKIRLAKVRRIRVVLNVARSQQQATSEEELDFAFRALPSALIAPRLELIEYVFTGLGSDTDFPDRLGNMNWEAVRQTFRGMRRMQANTVRPQIQVTWKARYDAAEDVQAAFLGLRSLQKTGMVRFESTPQKCDPKRVGCAIEGNN